MEKEIWKDIEGFKGFYQVSNYGRVKSLERKCKHNYGGLRRVKEKCLSQGKGKYYYNVVLAKEAKNKTLLTHRIVALHFVDNPYNKPEVNHKDGNKRNNYYLNLEWCTRSENEQHAYDNNLAVTHSENHHSAKLKNIDIPIIRERITKGDKLTTIAKDYKVTICAISAIKYNRKWKHVI